MSKSITLRIPIEPKAVQSVDAKIVHGRVFTYQPKDVVKFKERVRKIAIAAIPEGFKPFSTGIAVRYTHIFKQLESASATDRGLIRSSCVVYKSTRPDFDNLCKGCSDALTGVLWEDDGLIAKALVEKIYGSVDGIVVTVRELNWKDKLDAYLRKLVQNLGFSSEVPVHEEWWDEEQD